MEALNKIDALMVEAFAYIASSNLKRKNMYNLLKVFYLADKLHMERYGRFIFNDDYVALEKGPVPSRAWELVRNIQEGKELPGGLDAAISIVDHKISPNREFVDDLFSDSDLECIDEVIELSHKVDLGEESHDAAWVASMDRGEHYMPMDSILGILEHGEKLKDLVANRH